MSKIPLYACVFLNVQVQHDINPVMRGILVDWLVEVAEEYKLSPENLYLSANYVDRFLSIMPVLRGRLQLVGVTCMLIASKYEEIFAPQVEDFVYITDSTYSATEVLQMEVTVLNALRFNLTAVTPHCFIKRLTTVMGLDEQVPPPFSPPPLLLCIILAPISPIHSVLLPLNAISAVRTMCERRGIISTGLSGVQRDK